MFFNMYCLCCNRPLLRRTGQQRVVLEHVELSKTKNLVVECLVLMEPLGLCMCLYLCPFAPFRLTPHLFPMHSVRMLRTSGNPLSMAVCCL